MHALSAQHLTDAAALQVARAFVNPYKVLQLSEDADPSQIKRAYRKLALRLVLSPLTLSEPLVRHSTTIVACQPLCRHHPDINEEPSAEQDFLRIQEAYEMLTDRTHAEPSSKGSWDFHDWYALKQALQSVTPVSYHGIRPCILPAQAV